MDGAQLHWLPRLFLPPVSGVLRGVLRPALQGVAWGLVGDQCARHHSGVPQLGLPGAPPDLFRHPNRERPMKTLQNTNPITIQSWLTESDERLANDVLVGLTGPFKELPPKHFYDARGS